MSGLAAMDSGRWPQIPESAKIKRRAVQPSSPTREGPMRIEEPAEGLPEGSGAEAERAEPGWPRHLVWSTDRLDLRDPFQRKWYIRQILLHGREEDLRTLDLKEVAEILDELNLPSPLHRLWEMFLERKGLVKR